MKTDNDDSASARSPGKRVGIISGLALTPVITAAIGMVTNVTDLVDLFSERWQITTVVLGTSSAIAGVLLLIRLWRGAVGLPVIGAAALISVGGAALVFGVVGLASPTGPSSSSTSATKAKITSPLTGFRTSDTKVTVRVSAPPPPPGFVYMIAVEPSRQHNRYYFHHLIPEGPSNYIATAGTGPKDYEYGYGSYAIRLVAVDKQTVRAIDDYMEQAADYNSSGMAVPADVRELGSVVVERIP